MKQKISGEQLDELSKKAKKRYHDWLDERKEPTTFSNYLLSIGQLIEFLDEQNPEKFEIILQIDRLYVWYNQEDAYQQLELCDALWQAVKEVLEK